MATPGVAYIHSNVLATRGQLAFSLIRGVISAGLGLGELDIFRLWATM